MNLHCILALLLIAAPLAASAQTRLHSEKWYQEAYCGGKGMRLERVLDDGTRVDCEDASHVYEVEFADKWAESVGQSLYYAAKTKKQAVVILIMENPSRDNRYLRRLELLQRNGVRFELIKVTPSMFK